MDQSPTSGRSSSVGDPVLAEYDSSISAEFVATLTFVCVKTCRTCWHSISGV
jgi:hypothetical protein